MINICGNMFSAVLTSVMLLALTLCSNHVAFVLLHLLHLHPPFLLLLITGTWGHSRSAGRRVPLQRRHEGVPRETSAVQPWAANFPPRVHDHQLLAKKRLYARIQRMRQRVRERADGAVWVYLQRGRFEHVR